MLFAVYSVLAVADAVLNKALEPSPSDASPGLSADSSPGPNAASPGASPSLSASPSPGAGAELASLTLLAQRRDMLSHTLQKSSAGIEGRGSASSQGLGSAQGRGLTPAGSPLPLPALSWEQVQCNVFIVTLYNTLRYTTSTHEPPSPSLLSLPSLTMYTSSMTSPPPFLSSSHLSSPHLTPPLYSSPYSTSLSMLLLPPHLINMYNQTTMS